MDDTFKDNSFLYSKIKSYLVSVTKSKSFKIFILFFILFVGFYLFMQSAPNNFPRGQVITVYPGESLQEITNALYDANVISSKFIFRSTVILLSGERRVMAGDYLLNKTEGSFMLANRLVNGKYGIDVIKITVPEGWNVFQIADYLQKNLINFDRNSFLSLAKEDEGYLFPDTYFISPAVKINKLIELMKGNFDSKINDITDLKKSKHSLEEIITMASILESEANNTEDRKIVAGILWKRLEMGMSLQVDSTFSYINGKNTYELTSNDLKIDSPYNTYKYKGLPPTPINNPGLDSILAALNPTETKYLYFLSSKNGDMYYAKTFEEHKKNKELHLDS